MKKHFIDKGVLHPCKLKIAEKLRGKTLVDFKNSKKHTGAAEIELCPFLYFYSLTEINCTKLLNELESAIVLEWKKDGILKPEYDYPKFTYKGKRFVEYVLKWAYPDKYKSYVVNGIFYTM